MSPEAFYFLPKDAPPTFSKDEQLEKLPLPTLSDTLERYYKNLLPFGTEQELKNSRKVIDDFKNGIGAKLHAMLQEKAKTERNWVRNQTSNISCESIR
jgi:carnitine O-octanoyltransferase